MPEVTDPGTEGAAQGEVINVDDFKMNRQRNMKDGEKKGVKEERKRILEIRRVFAPHIARGSEYTDLMDECIDKGVPINRSIDALLEMLAGEHEPLAGEFLQTEHDGSMDRKTARDVAPARRGEITSGATEMEKFVEGVEEALLVKAGIITDKEKVKIIRANEFHSMSLSELPREYLRRAGDSARGSKLDIVGKALTRDGIISHGSSDFANLLQNVANKALQIGYEEAPETWQAWCRVGSLPDFRQGTRPNLSTFGDLQIVYENGEYKYGTFSDLKEVLTLVTYGKLFSISRQAIINDDLNSLSRIPQSMGRAAARKVGDLAYSVLTSGTSTLMNQDGVALFDASTHANYVTSGAAPSVTTIEAAKVAMGTQTDPAGNTLNIRPAFLIVPLAKEGTAQVLQSAQYDPAGTAGTLTPNTVQGTFTVVSDPRLDAFNSSGWFMAANPNMHETVEVAFLDGNQSPFMEQKEGWSQDGTEFKVRIDATAVALDYRGLYYNDGVT